MDIRAEFLNYFKQKGHALEPSVPLVVNDSTLLFVNAGMVPFKSVFTGEIPRPNPPRVASCQTCIRAGGKHNDLDNVGYTARHHTFFEMLGNFSFGDYFKEDAIAHAWEFVTEVLKLPKEKLWVTIHTSDDEAEKLWQKHIPLSKIKRFGDADNFWQMGDTGPCGPCSEIFIDQGSEHFNSDEDYLGGDGDRFLEIWNLVFMQYERDKNGNLEPLPRPSIDTGMGLERVIAVKEGKLSNYDSSEFMPLIAKVAEICNKSYKYETGASYRVIADHMRSTSFLLAQGVNFSNEGRGYVLRRITRRAIRHGYLLGIRKPFMYKLLDVINSLLGKQYPYLIEKKDLLKEQIRLEEERFLVTISSGIEIFENELKNTKDIFSGNVAFKLYDTCGFPLDLTQDMLRDKGLKIDISKYNKLMEAQRNRSKSSWRGSGDKVISGDFKTILERVGQNDFVGYSRNINSKAKVLALLDDNFKEVKVLEKSGWIMLDKTPFYAQSGGQCGDKGEIVNFGKVTDTQKFFELNFSKIELKSLLHVDEKVNVKVDISRNEIAKHHSATHLLHSALKTILGKHIAQAGSLVEKSRLRFDFSHTKAMSAEEIISVEDFVNDIVATSRNSVTKVMSIDDAKKSGAMALFGEKYGDKVRVVTLGNKSKELCGGTHVENVGEIGSFIISKESGVSAGVRRIEAICGASSLEYTKTLRDNLNQIKEIVKHKDAIIGVEKIKNEIQTLKNEVKYLEENINKQVRSETVNGVELVVDVLSAGDVKKTIDDYKNKKQSIAILLLQVKNSKVSIVAGVKNAPLKADEWIKKVAPIIGGSGGGRSDFAQAGGTNVSRVDDAKKVALKFAKNILES
ncbi:MAG: alanine--tRNA ligase [Sulfurospirillum sp.]|nr:alanine--tRNA ligase [Sulfurospirillum sp.]